MGNLMDGNAFTGMIALLAAHSAIGTIVLLYPSPL
jgi:hypothetical protein